MIEKFRGEEYIMHRHKDNPIITVENFPVPARAVFNCGQTMFEGKYLLLIAAIYNESLAGIHVAISEDGINFDINPQPLFESIDWTGGAPGIYDGWIIDPRVTKIDDTYYVVRPAQIRPPVGKGIGPGALLFKTKDFKTAEFVECIALPPTVCPAFSLKKLTVCTPELIAPTVL